MRLSFAGALGLAGLSAEALQIELVIELGLLMAGGGG